MNLQYSPSILSHKAIEYSLALSDGPGSGKINCQKSLQKALGGFGLSCEVDLEITNHYNLKQYPQFCASLSHTGNIGAALLSSINKYSSVGIDIELKGRKITPGAQKYYFNEHDKPDSNPLDIWIKKEAAFKAISPLLSKFRWKKVLLLKHIWIKRDKFGLMGRKKVLGKILKLDRKLGNREIIIAVALLNLDTK